MSLTNIDNLLVKVQHDEPVEPISLDKPAETQQESVDSDESEGSTEEKLTHLEKFRKDKEEFLNQQNESLSSDEQSTDLNDENEGTNSQDQQETDDYGNKVPKAKVYTEEEVQAMIRKRLKLHHEEKQAPVQPQYQPTQPQQQPDDSFQHDQGSELPWEVQLEQHIEKTVHKLKDKEANLAWQQEAQRAQAEFEGKFTRGMSKYADFETVVSGKPITNGILRAAQSMEDPAAFIYAAAKQQPKELERIAAITDPYVLAAEVGRLEERMKKARNISKAPKPGTRTRGDIADKGMTKVSLDDLIRHDAKRKLGRR